MIQCPKCKSENQIGAIFCRTCSEKLDLDNLEPADLIAKNTAGGNAIYFLMRLCSLILLVVGGGVIVLMVLKPPFTEYPALSEKEQVGILNKYKRMGKRKPVALTEPQATFIISDVLLELDEASKLKQKEIWLIEGAVPNFLADGVIVEFPVDGVARVHLKSIAFEKLDLYTSVQGRLGTGSNGVDFDITKVWLGRLPIPHWLPFVREFAMARFESVQSGKPQVQSTKKSIRTARVTAGSVAVTR
ncbi:MAG TPA: hypothetical protein DCR55_02080 [Lentisphaeria bacterium]|jgi:hypothetical protein|nr:hypothetical protein [Lentisphaeria bacterium]